MMNNAVSVAMAVYNGEKFIQEQIDSILVQMENDDELIISYNASTDSTWHIIQSYTLQDARVHVYACDEKGVVANFENAIKKCKHEIILLSDQDDVWCDTKLSAVREIMKDDSVTLVLHGKYVTDGSLNVKKIVTVEKVSKSFLQILMKCHYTGCCTAFRKNMVPYLIPFPRKILHDWWLAMITSIYGKIVLLPEPMIYYRRHGENESSEVRRSIRLVLRDRIYAAWFVMLRILRRVGQRCLTSNDR